MNRMGLTSPQPAYAFWKGSPAGEGTPEVAQVSNRRKSQKLHRSQ
jgi:hypothetical protein